MLKKNQTKNVLTSPQEPLGSIRGGCVLVKGSVGTNNKDPPPWVWAGFWGPWGEVTAASLGPCLGEL